MRGLSRSHEMGCYEPDSLLDDKSGPIIFLKRRVFVLQGPDGKINKEIDSLALTCAGAFESQKNKKAVIRLIKAFPLKARLEITVGVRENISVDNEIALINRLKQMFPGYTSYSWKTLDICPVDRQVCPPGNKFPLYLTFRQLPYTVPATRSF